MQSGYKFPKFLCYDPQRLKPNKQKQTNEVVQRKAILIWIQFLILMCYEMDYQSQDGFYATHQKCF